MRVIPFDEFKEIGRDLLSAFPGEQYLISQIPASRAGRSRGILRGYAESLGKFKGDGQVILALVEGCSLQDVAEAVAPRVPVVSWGAFVHGLPDGVIRLFWPEGGNYLFVEYPELEGVERVTLGRFAQEVKNREIRVLARVWGVSERTLAEAKGGIK